MIAEARYPKTIREGTRKPPIPKEHGAWVILYVPMLIGVCLTGKTPPLHCLCLFLAATAAFLARESAGLLLKKRGKEGTTLWLGVYLSVLALSATPLLLAAPRPLLTLGGLATLLFLAHSRLQTLPADKLPERRVWGEALGVSALTLTAPAAYALSVGALDRMAWSLWAWCALYFLGGVLYVEMWLNAAKRKKDWSPSIRRQAARVNHLYHLGLTVLVVSIILATGERFALCLLLALTPALFRAFYGGKTLTNQPPPLKRVGVMETLRAFWFAAWFLAGFGR